MSGAIGARGATERRGPASESRCAESAGWLVMKLG